MLAKQQGRKKYAALKVTNDLARAQLQAQLGPEVGAMLSLLVMTEKHRKCTAFCRIKGQRSDFKTLKI
jgi:hypothetical protein